MNTLKTKNQHLSKQIRQAVSRFCGCFACLFVTYYPEAPGRSGIFMKNSLSI